MQKIDWSGRKYLVAQELGECIDIIFCQIEDNKKNWYLRSHSLSDGVGAFSELLAIQNPSLNNQPQSQRIKKPNLFKRIILLFKYLNSTRSIDYKWKSFNKNKKGAGPGVAFSLFDKNKTAALKSLAKKQGISLNSLLLYCLDKVVVTRLLEGPQERAWLIPVNMRGEIPIVNASANYTASMTLRFEGAPSMNDFDVLLKSLYNSGIAWGSWIYSNITKYVGPRILKRLFKNYKPCWVGVFSNMGVWPIEGQADQEKVNWMVSPPVTSLCPVTSAALTWEGQLGLSLQLHPSIASNRQDIEVLMHEWMDTISELAEESESLQPMMFTQGWQGLEDNAQRF